MKKIIFLIAFVLLSADAFAECIIPENGMNIMQSTVLCTGEYEIPDGISVNGNDITLDCSKASLTGSLYGKGIYAKGNNIIIKNCILSSYDYGIYLESVPDAQLKNNNISDSIVGIYSLDSDAIVSDNIYQNNEKDFLDVSKEEITLPAVSETEQTAVSAHKRVYFENITEQEIVYNLGIKEGYEKAKDIIDIKRDKAKIGASVQYTLTVTSKKEVVGLMIYEHIPKNLADNSNKISSSAEFKVINEDPDIVFRLGHVKEGDSRVITYTISEADFSAKDPFAFAAIERTIEQTDSWIIRGLFVIALFLVLITRNIKKKQAYFAKKNL